MHENYAFDNGICFANEKLSHVPHPLSPLNIPKYASTVDTYSRMTIRPVKFKFKFPTNFCCRLLSCFQRSLRDLTSCFFFLYFFGKKSFFACLPYFRAISPFPVENFERSFFFTIFSNPYHNRYLIFWARCTRATI